MSDIDKNFKGGNYFIRYLLLKTNTTIAIAHLSYEEMTKTKKKIQESINKELINYSEMHK